MKSIRSVMWKPRYFDIGVNFSDLMFQGYYNHSNTAKHPPDLEEVILRAHTFNVDKMLITTSSIKESSQHLGLCDKYPGFYSTVGVHPCTVAEEFYVKSDEGYSEELADDAEEKLKILHDIVVDGVGKGIVKAFGEIGLDYDRLHYSSKTQQTTMFKKQLEVIASLKHLELPLFLHMRNACDDFIDILTPFIEDGSIKRGNGVVHSFTGTEKELEKLLDLGFFIGVNGCSLKTDENLLVAKKIPMDKLMIETDAPWCEIRKSHASHKFLTPYPNKFYPEIIEPKVESSEEDPTPEFKPKSKKQQQKNNPIKLDDFIPFPSIKKENYQKHKVAVESISQPVISKIGILAPPLIKSRNEPVFVGLVAEIVCKLHNLGDKEIEETLDLIYHNSCKLLKV